MSVTDLVGRDVIDPDGDKIGTVERIYQDDKSGEATWLTVAVSHGLLGKKGSHFAPLHNARLSGEDVVLNVTREKVEDAPELPDEGHLDPSAERALYEYYSGYAGVSGGDYPAAQATDPTDAGQSAVTE